MTNEYIDAGLLEKIHTINNEVAYVTYKSVRWQQLTNLGWVTILVLDNVARMYKRISS